MFAAVYGHTVQRGDRAAAQRCRAAYLPHLDSIFSFFEAHPVEVFGREIPQVQLLHVSRLNVEAMPDNPRDDRGPGLRPDEPPTPAPVGSDGFTGGHAHRGSHRAESRTRRRSRIRGPRQAIERPSRRRARVTRVD